MMVRRNMCLPFVRHTWIQILQVYMYAYVYIYFALAAWEIMTEGQYLQFVVITDLEYTIC